MTRNDLIAQLHKLEFSAKKCRLAVRGKHDFMKALDVVENDVKKLRKMVVQYSRSIKQGIRLNGEPDLRFSVNRDGD